MGLGTQKPTQTQPEPRKQYTRTQLFATRNPTFFSDDSGIPRNFYIDGNHVSHSGSLENDWKSETFQLPLISDR